MNLLRDGLANGTVLLTEQSKKMTIDGITKVYPIYKVKLENLFYNDQNDRIATWVSQYQADNHIDEIDNSDRENFNKIVQDFVIKSNPDKIKETKQNIHLVGQQENGIVLNDGRIIDGNRRFTCLRQLAENDPKFGYFETIILDRDLENSAKQIKMLELQIQIGKEARVDYNPIDRMVGLYRDIEVHHLLTVKEYATSSGQKTGEVEKQLRQAKLIAEFLESIKAPGQFYIARDMELSSPINELDQVLNKITDEDQCQQLKYIAFANFVAQPSKDMTRFIRNLKSISKTSYLDEFIEKEMEISEEILDSIPDEGKDIAKAVSSIRSDKEIKDNLSNTMELVSNKVKASETRSKPVQNVAKAISFLEAIDPQIVCRLNPRQKKEILADLTRLSEMVEDMKASIH